MRDWTHCCCQGREDRERTLAQPRTLVPAILCSTHNLRPPMGWLGPGPVTDLVPLSPRRQQQQQREVRFHFLQEMRPRLNIPNSGQDRSQTHIGRPSARGEVKIRDTGTRLISFQPVSSSPGFQRGQGGPWPRFDGGLLKY